LRGSRNIPQLQEGDTRKLMAPLVVMVKLGRILVLKRVRQVKREND
jgi:hypothetical protein